MHGCQQPRRERCLHAGHLFRRNVEVTLVVEGVNDRSPISSVGEGDARQQPHVPDQREAATSALSAASTKPAAVFFGMWMGMNPSRGRT